MQTKNVQLVVNSSITGIYKIKVMRANFGTIKMKVAKWSGVKKHLHLFLLEPTSVPHWVDLVLRSPVYFWYLKGGQGGGGGGCLFVTGYLLFFWRNNRFFNTISTFAHPIIHLVYSLRFCIIIVCTFPWEDKDVPREIENNAYASFFGGKQSVSWDLRK